MEEIKELVKFLYEMGQLKRVKRSGWWAVGVKDPETVAEHSFRAIVIGKILAHLEKADEDKVASMILYHDIPEARINDLHKVGALYLDKHVPEEKVLREQIKRLPESLHKEAESLFEEYTKRVTKEALVAKDADILELCLSVKEHQEQNYQGLESWFVNAEKQIKTETGKKIFRAIRITKSTSWWEDIQEIQDLLAH